MSGFERGHIVHSEPIIAVRAGLLGGINDDTVAEQPVDRDLIGGHPAARKMDRGVHMGAAMLRQTQRVGGIKVPAIGFPVGELVVFEVNRRGRPKNRAFVEGVGEIDDLELG